jgi:uncharacterized repeat protein (TIGR03803 family)
LAGDIGFETHVSCELETNAVQCHPEGPEEIMKTIPYQITRAHRLQAMVVMTLMLCLASLVSSSAQTLTTLYSFSGPPDGAGPSGSLIQAKDGNFYGITGGGGPNCGVDGCGTVFKITPSGTLTTLYNFCSLPNCADGFFPFAGLIQASDDNFYGTASAGGANGMGTVFQITASGTLTTLHSFDGSDGSSPFGAVVQGRDGNFYGTTNSGGAGGGGTVFKMTPSGTLTTLFNFCFQDSCDHGSSPEAGLVQGRDGNFYGTTEFGGPFRPAVGTAFKITPSGTLTTLQDFTGGNGAYPEAGLIQATDGNFYGATRQGGTNGYGTIFKLTSGGTLTTLYNFRGYPIDGGYPLAALVQAIDGNFYGTTFGGGPNSDGTVFKITPTGTLTILQTFDGSNGFNPSGGLVQATDGSFYGTTNQGGAGARGTIFRLTDPLDCIVCRPPQ